MTEQAPRVQLTDGSPVTPDHREIDPATGQQKGYVVLAPEERAKGFVRPVRRSYVHAGFGYCGADLGSWREQPNAFGYVSCICGGPPSHEDPHGDDGGHSVFVATQRELDRLKTTGRYKGCGTLTTMGIALAETYARDPKFYGGTFCAGCSAHFPVSEFLWEGTDEVVGS